MARRSSTDSSSQVPSLFVAVNRCHWWISPAGGFAKIEQQTDKNIFWPNYSFQLRFDGPQRGGREQRKLQQLQDSGGLAGAQVGERSDKVAEGTELLHMHQRRTLPNRDEDRH